MLKLSKLFLMGYGHEGNHVNQANQLFYGFKLEV